MIDVFKFYVSQLTLVSVIFIINTFIETLIDFFHLSNLANVSME